MRKAYGTLGPAVAEFAEGCLKIPKGEHQGEAFILSDWQREDTNIIYETDELGRPLWKTVVYGLARGSGKSPLTAVYANHALIDGGGSPEVVCAAAAKDQAGIVHKFANKTAKDGPLEDFLEFPRVTEALGPIRCPHNGGILRVISADGDLQQGLSPTFIVLDELHAFKTGKQIGLYDAMATTLHKSEAARMIIITTAGENKDSLLGDLVDAIEDAGESEITRHGCKKIVRDYEAKRLLIWYGAPEDADITDPTIWRACNPAAWITDESLRVAAKSNPESTFRRFYLNQWVKGEDAAIQPGAWDECEGPAQIESGAKIWIGVDVGEKRDTSGVAWVAAGADGIIGRAKTFRAEKITGMETSLPAVEGWLRKLRDDYDVQRINFDQWQMRDMAARLASEGFPMIEFPQNNTNMVPASQLLFDLIKDRKIQHDGDKTLRAHVLGTGAEITATGGWRFTKVKTKAGHRDLKRQNDACIALAMAAAGWLEDTSQPQEASFQQTGGVWTIDL